MSITEYNTDFYETRYRQGYENLYPESHIIRAYKYVLEWELGIKSGNVFDFGCGTGGNLKYFMDLGFTPYGCDTSQSAINQCKRYFHNFVNNFNTSVEVPDLVNLTNHNKFDVFLSNQVLYYLNDDKIKEITKQAYSILRPGGAFVVTMMDYSCWYARYITGSEGDFKVVDVNSPRQKFKSYLNLKRKEELETLFLPFKKQHIGWYTTQLREEEGPTTHWVYIGVR